METDEQRWLLLELYRLGYTLKLARNNKLYFTKMLLEDNNKPTNCTQIGSQSVI